MSQPKDLDAQRSRDRDGAFAVQALELSLDPCFRLGPEGRVQAVNRAFCLLLGQARESLIDRPLPVFDPAYAADLKRRQAQMDEQQSVSFETVLQARDGSPVPLELSATRLVVDGQVWLFASGRDLRPRYELQDRLRQVEKLETLGELVGGVAHDFNNLLAIFSAGLDQLRPPVGGESPYQAMQVALDRGAALVRRLQAFARHRRLQSQPADLAQWVKDSASRLQGILGPHLELQVECPAELPLAQLDPGLVEEILFNLALNARDATGGRGRFSLTLEPAWVGLDAARAMGVQPGAYVALLAQDDGPGVPANIAGRIFDPFFTTKPQGQGSGLGLGLASAYGIARQHGGRLELLASDQGARFRLLLPQAPPDPSASAPKVPPPKGRLLLVDDEGSLLELLAPALGRQGYQVATAGDGALALALWEAQGAFDLLVTDLSMPGMDGRELARRLREKNPSLPILFISGWSPEVADPAPGTLLLAKPFRLTELYRALDQLRVEGPE